MLIKLRSKKAHTQRIPFINGTTFIMNGDSAILADTGQVVAVNGAMWSSFSKVGGGSIYFDNTTDNFTVPASVFNFGYNDYTVEFWMYIISCSASGYVTLCGNNLSTPHIFALQFGDAGYNNYLQVFSGPNVTSSDPLPTTFTKVALTGNWHHVAVTREAGTVRIFVDGVVRNTRAMNYDISTTGTTLGRFGSPSATINGYLDNIRVINGTAAYTANFTPPTLPFATS